MWFVDIPLDPSLWIYCETLTVYVRLDVLVHDHVMAFYSTQSNTWLDRKVNVVFAMFLFFRNKKNLYSKNVYACYTMYVHVCLCVHVYRVFNAVTT